jgi:hypothetical protein
MRRRRGTAAVSPDGELEALIASSRAWVYCLPQKNGTAVWYARGADGDIFETIPVRVGSLEESDVVDYLCRRVFGEDVVESWSLTGPSASSSERAPSRAQREPSGRATAPRTSHLALVLA